MIRDYPKYKPFRFWCQKVLPLVYDDSLSYYELLNKVVDYLNNVIKDVNALGTAFEELSTMVTDYFENLDVQEEIDNKLDSMVEDGTLDAMIQPLVGDAVSEWLEGNVTPTGSAVLVDSTLTISGAAADAKVTGDEISDLKSDLSTLNDECGIYVPPTARGTTAASSSAQAVLTGLSLIKGHTYKYEVTYASPSDTLSYLALWQTGGSSYLGVVTINAGSTTGYGQHTAQADIPSAYVALTTNGRALNYTVKITDLSITKTRIDDIEDATEQNADAIQATNNTIDSVKETVIGVYIPPTSTGRIGNGDGNKTILDNLTVTENRRYGISLTLTNPVNVASYLSLWDGTSSNYQRIWTVPSGSATFDTTFVAAFSADSVAYIKLNTQNRETNYTVTFADISTDHPNNIQENAKSIDTLSGETTVKAYNQKITKDISQDCVYTTGAVQADGSIYTSQTGYVYTNKIPVSPGDVVYMLGYTTNYYSRVTAYYNDTALPSEAKSNIRTYTVPDGVNQIVITVANNIIRTKELIIIDSYSETVNSAVQPANNALRNFSHTYAKRTPMVTFIDDDGNVECYTDLFPIFKQHSVPLVSAYMGDSNPTMVGGTFMSRDQCREIVQAGGEIVVHYNPSLTDLALDEAERIVLQSKDALAKNGFYSRLVVYSNGTSNSAIRAMISKHFDAAFSGGYPRAAYDDRSNHDCIAQYAIHRENGGGFYYDTDPESSTLQYFKDMIDECIAANGWLVFTLHSWLMPEGKRDERWENIDQLGLLEDMIEYIEELQTGGSNIRIVTASEGLATFGNAWQAGDYLGPWNEQTFANLPTMGDHSEPGCAINKLGQYDFPTGNNITPQGS